MHECGEVGGGGGGEGDRQIIKLTLQDDEVDKDKAAAW